MNEADTTSGGKLEGADERLLVALLARWVDAVQRHAGASVLAILIVSIGLGGLASQTVGFNVDPNALFSEDLRFQKMISEFSRYFPVLTNSLLIVVDGTTPEGTRSAQIELADALAKRGDVFHRVFLPGEDPFFERSGLLYGSLDQLEDFADHMAMLQPVLGELSQNPTLPTLARVIRLGLEEADENGVDAERWETVLDHFRSATVAVFEN